MNVTLLDIVHAARARAVPFAAETAAYLMLCACEQLAQAPRRTSLSDIGLTAEGGVQVEGSVPAAMMEVERELRELLGQLIEVASSPGPALARAASRGALGGVAALGAELEKALIPFNRAAARRALIRLHRDTELYRASALAPQPAKPSETTMAADSGASTPVPSEAPRMRAEEPPPSEMARLRHVPDTRPRPPPTPTPSPRGSGGYVPPSRPGESSVHRGWVQVEAVTRPETRMGRLRAGQVSARPRPMPAWAVAELSLGQPLGRPSLPELASIPVSSPHPPSVGLSGSSLADGDRTERVPAVDERVGADEWLEVPEFCSEADTPGMLALAIEDIVEASEVTPRPAAALQFVPAYAGMPAARSAVVELVEDFAVSANAASEAELRQELKALAGLELTPGPAPGARANRP